MKPTPAALAVAREIRKARIEFGMTQRQLAHEIRVKPRTVEQIEAGVSNREKTILRACEWLGVKVRQQTKAPHRQPAKQAGAGL